MALDLLVKLNTGEQVNIELQSLPHSQFVERLLYYWKHLYGRDLKKGDPYYKLKPAYSLIFADFSLFETQSKDFLNSFSIRSDKPPHFVLTSHFGMTIVDLRLFLRYNGSKCKGLVDMKSLWCYFISRSSSLTSSDFKVLTRYEVFKVAKEILKDLSMDSALRFQELQREKAMRDSFSFALDAKEEGRQEGREEGMQKGLEKGMQQGMQKGRQERNYEVIVNMLKENVEISVIAKVTGLSEEEIKKLIKA